MFRLGFLSFTGIAGGSIILLVFSIPLLSMLFGNIYCGYLCPFGALQELIGDLKPLKLRTDPDKNNILRFSKYVKYILLFFLALFAAAAMNPSAFAFDPLTGFFRLYGDAMVILFSVFILVLSFFYKRLWCRNLCPVGAFLSLVGRIKLLRFLRPGTAPAYCDLGIRKAADIDCISCDRCRIKEIRKREKATKHDTYENLREGAFFLIILILVIVLVAGQFLSLSKGRTSVDPGDVSIENITTGGIEGRPRDVDINRINDLIKRGYLSDEEAEFYKKFK
jgi:hypothetical protein